MWINGILDNQIIHINLEEPEPNFKDYMELYNYVKERLNDGMMNYVFIDEVQNVNKQEKLLDYFKYGSLPQTVENYISAFLESYLLYKVDRFDVKGKDVLASGYKYYTSEIGFRSYLLGKKMGQDMGHILENVVFLELLRRGYKVYTGKVDDLEVDFVAENRDGLKYYQVAWDVRSEDTLKKELKPLQKTCDFYPKFLLTMDRDLETDYNGITKINIIDWLLEDYVGL